MLRSTLLLGLICSLSFACTSADSGATTDSQTTSEAGGTVAESAGPAVGTPEWKIAAFTSAAPPEIAMNATVMDWPDSASNSMPVLRPGTNGWTCMPSTPSALGVVKIEDAAPMCLDQAWMTWAEAWLAKKTPNVTSVGIGYMLHGDQGASNTDPYATAATADNNWTVTGPHIMVITPNKAHLSALPTDPKTGGPFVMWKDTPYAHIMVPVGASMQHEGMAHKM